MSSTVAAILLALLLMAGAVIVWSERRVRVLERQNLALRIRTGSPQPGMVEVDERFIETYEFPRGMIERALERCPPGVTPAQLDEGLRQYLIAAGTMLALGSSAAMPSRVVDEAWHEFMLYTRDYAAFCGEAYGSFLHHRPEVAMSEAALECNRTSALVNTWWSACRQQGLSPARTLTAPLLFTIDAEAGVPGAVRYVAVCDPGTGSLEGCCADDGTVCVAHGLAAGRLEGWGADGLGLIRGAGGRGYAGCAGSGSGGAGGDGGGGGGCGGGGCGGGS